MEVPTVWRRGRLTAGQLVRLPRLLVFVYNALTISAMAVCE